MEHTPHTFTEWLSNLSAAGIVGLVIVLTAIRLITVRLIETARAKRAQPALSQAARTTMETADSLLYAFAVAFLVVKPVIGQPFYVPSGSMEPTLLGDSRHEDRVWVDKLGYRIHSPQRGDVVVFFPPPQAVDQMPNSGGDPVHFIKRLVAAGGDRIETKAGALVVNGVRYSHIEVRNCLAHAGLFKTVDSNEERAVDHVKFIPNGILVNGKFLDKARISQMFTGAPHARVDVYPGQTTLNGQVLTEPYAAEDPDYDLKISHGMPLKHDYGLDQGYRLNGVEIDAQEYKTLAARPCDPLPKGTYFMMGDNRNDSQDSTEWGPLKSDRVVGKATAIFWPPNRVTGAL